MRAQNNIPTNITQQKFSTNHSFNTELAHMYGQEEAVLLNHFIHWISVNKRMGRNNKDGRTWMYQTQEEMAAHYSYWTRKQIMRILGSLVKQKVLRVGNYNKNKFDQTQWYAFENEEMFTAVPNGTILFSEQDYHENQSGPSYIGKDTRTDTKKQQQGSPQKKIAATPKPLTFAAAPSAKEEQPAAEIKCEALKNLDIPHTEKEWLQNTFDLPDIELAVAWAIDPPTPLKKPMAAGIKWHCSQNQKDKPLPRTQNPKDFDHHQKIAKQAENCLEHPSGYTLIALSKHVIIERGSYKQPTIINYGTPNFLETLTKTLKDYGFQRRT